MRRVILAAVVLAACNLLPQVALAADGRNKIPFKLYRGYAIVAHGSIGNLKNLNFLIDTGAIPSILDRRIAKKLNLSGTSASVSVFTKKLEAEQVVAPNLRLGSLQTDALPVVVQDLSFAGSGLGTQVDAVIGFDFLGQTAFTIDYESKEIIIGPIDPALIAIPYRAGPGYAVVEMQVQQEKISLLVDTGANDLVLFGDALRRCPNAIKKVRTQSWSNMGGEIQVQQVELQDASLASGTWKLRDVFVLEQSSGPAGLQGLLGVASLKARRVGFDPDRGIFGWEKSGN